MKIVVERAYDEEQTKGTRVLVDRVWPRGVKKEALGLDRWAKDVAPSAELRKWFGHKAERWDAFKERYFRELEENAACWQPLLEAAEQGCLVLIYGAKDRERNQAVVLREFLKEQHA